MKRQLSIFFALAFAAAFLMPVSCKKETQPEDYVSQETFISKLKGNWFVHELNSASNSQPLLLTIQYGYIYPFKDSVSYLVWGAWCNKYSIHDPILCTLAEMDHIQFWMIYGDSDGLFLSTHDLCGDSASYQIEYSNYHWVFPELYSGMEKPGIKAEMKLVSQNKTIPLNGFFYNGDFPSLSFTITDGENQWNLDLIPKLLPH
jgi:hypothetical protein